MKILVTGANSRFGKILRNIKTKKKLIFKDKKDLNILSERSIRKNLKKYKPNFILHLAGLSRPMSQHSKNIVKSINLNIIGTCNLVKEASLANIKLIYLSTNYIYPGDKGNYAEEDPLRPWNNYGWSKLGGESAVHLYKNSLILRVSMTEKPFLHKKAFVDLKTNFMFHDELSKNLLKLIKYKGVINVGGKTQTVFNFAKKSNKKIKKISAKKIYGKNYPLNQSMNTEYYKKILNKK